MCMSYCVWVCMCMCGRQQSALMNSIILRKISTVTRVREFTCCLPTERTYAYHIHILDIHNVYGMLFLGYGVYVLGKVRGKMVNIV